MLPEEIELLKKRAVLERLKDRLADREEEMAELRSDLEQFEAQYKMKVGRLYAEFDEVEAQIAEEEVKLVPDDEEIKKRAEELRRRAEESAAEALVEDTGEKRRPTAEAKKAYHELARSIHPDLALDPTEKEKRHGLMAELNRAYSAGNQSELDRLMENLRVSPETVVGDTIGDDLIRVIRQLHQVRSRLTELRAEREDAEATELFTLREKVYAELALGRDLLSQMAERTRTHIRKSERRLENLRNVNKAQEEYVKEKFGMDISEFR